MTTTTVPVTAIVTFADVAKLNTAKLTRYAFGMCKDANMADDIVQSALLSVFSKIAKIGDFEVPFLDVEKFVQKVMRNKLWDILKNKKSQRIECSDNAVESFENATKDTTEINPEEMVEMIGFSELEKRLIELMMNGHETREICEIMEISKDYFWKLSQRIRDKVRDSIE